MGRAQADEQGKRHRASGQPDDRERGGVDQAIELANDSHYGLAASLYTRDVRRAQRVARAIQAGTVSINGFSEGDITTPFGGYKQSGFGGRDNGLEALDQYQQVKTIWYVN